MIPHMEPGAHHTRAIENTTREASDALCGHRKSSSQNLSCQILAVMTRKSGSPKRPHYTHDEILPSFAAPDPGTGPSGRTNNRGKSPPGRKNAVKMAD
jgi:hypothetical protein